jgi:hypothetical protein
MPSDDVTQSPRPSADLAKRLRARARRARMLRRRIAVLAVTLMAGSWGTVAAFGGLGASAATPATTAVLVAGRRGDDGARSVATTTRTGQTTTVTTRTSVPKTVTTTVPATGTTPAATAANGGTSTLTAVTTSES